MEEPKQLQNSDELIRLLLSRRKFMLGAGSALLAAALPNLEGCGGGGGGVAGATSMPATKISSTVVFPKGFTGSNFTAMSGAGSSSVAGSGHFTAYIGAQGPQIVYVLDSSGRLLLAGPISSTRTTLNSRSMAEFLAFNALGAFAHAGAISSAVWTLLATADVSGIQSAIESAISSSGNAWSTKSQPQLTTALKAFATSILGDASSEAAKPKSPSSEVAARPDGIIVNPTDAVSGIQVSSDDLQTCTATNNYRRRTWLYSSPISQTVNGTSTNLPLSLTSTVLPATSGVTSVLTSLAQLAAGATFYTQTAVTIDTPLSDSSASQKTYAIWVVGPAAHAGVWTSVPADVKTGWWEVTSLSIVVDYLIPWLANLAVPVFSKQIDVVLAKLNVASGGGDVSDLNIVLKDVLGELSSADSIRSEAFSGDLAGAIQDSALLFLNSGTAQALLIHLFSLVAAEFTTNGNVLVNQIYKTMMGLLGALDFGASVFDAAIQVVDLALSNTIETFNIVVTPPKLSITPTNPTMGFGSKATFTANLVGAAASDIPITYDWTVTDGQLKNPKGGTTGTSVSTSGTTVDYTSPSAASQATGATITVTAYLYGPSNPNRKKIATAQTSITLSNTVVVKGQLSFTGDVPTPGRFTWAIYTQLPIPNGAVSVVEVDSNFDDPAYYGASITQSGTFDGNSWDWSGGNDLDGSPAGSHGILYNVLTGGAFGIDGSDDSSALAQVQAEMNGRFGGMIVTGTFQIGS